MKPIIRSITARWLRRPVMVVAALAAGLGFAAAPSQLAEADSSICPGANVAAFGPNVCVFNDTMSQAAIQTDLNNISTQQVPNQFGTQRYAIFFEPGTYGSTTDPLVFTVGYYTSVAGLGLNPGGVVINGAIDSLNQCSGGSCTALDNFWRSVSNLTINVTGGTGCYANAEFWAVSQASPMRRVHINGNVTLFDYCSSPSYSSGGFIADSQFTGGTVINGSQQQFMTRNSDLDGWTNSVWNQVFCGTNGAPPQDFVMGGNQYTTLASCPVTEEEPFLYTDSQGNYNVFVPAVQRNSSGPSWASGTAAGTSIPLSKFFVASPGMSGSAMTSAMARGLNLILTPGVYNLNQPIVVPHPDTVVLGLGMATLVPQHGNAAMIVVPNNGVKVSGLIIDAGPVNSPVLVSVGTPGPSSASDPDLIQDVFFRIGGAATTPVSATVSLLDNAGNSIIDDVWAWRADHGNAVGWTVNTGRHRRRGDRKRRDRLRPVHGALPEERGDLERPGRYRHLLPERAALRPAQPVGLDGQPDPGRLPRLPGHPQRQELPGVRDGQLCRVHPDLGDVVQRPGLPVPPHSRRTVPRPPRRVDRWFGG